MRIIKSYHILTTTYRDHPEALPYDSDLAVAKFRAFFVEASEMTRRVREPLAKNVLREVLETLLQDLADK